MDLRSEAPCTKEEELPPPAYSDSSYSTYAPSTLTPTSQYYSSQIQTQLGALTTQIASVETQRELLSNAQDEKILSLLTTDIQIYLSDMAKTGFRRGALILVPSKALKSDKAVPSEFESASQDEFNRLVRVNDKEGNSNGDMQTWYWNDEYMAKRLVSCLQPQPDPRTMKLPLRKEEVKTETATGSSRGFWTWKKSAPHRVPVPELKKEVKDTRDRIEMVIKAEEVTLRWENEFGMWNMEVGYGIVVRLEVAM